MICFRHLLYPILSENNEYLRLVISATVAGLLTAAIPPDPSFFLFDRKFID